MFSPIALNGFTDIFKKFHGVNATCFTSYYMKWERGKSKKLLLISLSAAAVPSCASLSLSLLLSGSVCRIVVVSHYLRLSDCWRFQADAVLWHLTLAVNDLSAWHLSSGTCFPHSTLPTSFSVSLLHSASFSRWHCPCSVLCSSHLLCERVREGETGKDNGKIPAEQLFAHLSFREREVWSLQGEGRGGEGTLVQKFLHQIHLVSFVA